MWYLGEATAKPPERAHGPAARARRLAGRDAARAGIYMPGDPYVGRSGTQEFYAGHAEDHFWFLDLHAIVRSPFVSSRDALLTQEWTPLEPGVLDQKLYVRGVGVVREETVRGGSESAALVVVRRG